MTTLTAWRWPPYRHCRSLRRGGSVATESHAWFDNVRVYPRPESHHVGVRLVRANGGAIWYRENDGWPPKIIDKEGKARSIEDLEAQLGTRDGKTQVAALRSANMGFYLLPLKNAPWDVYPVAAELRVLLDGQALGSPPSIESRGVRGLCPDDVYEIVIPEPDKTESSSHKRGTNDENKHRIGSLTRVSLGDLRAFFRLAGKRGPSG